MPSSHSPPAADRGPLAALAEVRRALLHTQDRDAMLGEACRLAVEVAGVRMAWVGLVEGDGRVVRVAGTAGAVGTYLDDLRIELEDPVLGRGAHGAVHAGRRGGGQRRHRRGPGHGAVAGPRPRARVRQLGRPARCGTARSCSGP